MFLGNYTLLAYLPVRALGNPCIPLVWLTFSGLAVPLILATMFVKMLRIYEIFSDPFSFQRKRRYFSNPFLLLYVLMLVCPSFVVLLVWSTYDSHTSFQLESPADNHVLVYPICLSGHTIKWLAAVVFYFLLLCVALICLAIKISKIRRKHFRDTKASNAFVYLTSLLITLTLAYWYFFYNVPATASSVLAIRSVLYVGHTIMILLCQCLLFVPKVYPPLKRKLTRNQVKRK